MVGVMWLIVSLTVVVTSLWVAWDLGRTQGRRDAAEDIQRFVEELRRIEFPSAEARMWWLAGHRAAWDAVRADREVL